MHFHTRGWYTLGGGDRSSLAFLTAEDEEKTQRTRRAFDVMGGERPIMHFLLIFLFFSFVAFDATILDRRDKPLVFSSIGTPRACNFSFTQKAMPPTES